MHNRLLSAVPPLAHCLAIVVSAVCATFNPAYVSSAGAQASQPADSSHPAAPVHNTPQTAIAGVPNLPDIVTIVPFYWKANETGLEKTKVIIPAEVDGRRGNFVVDLGDPSLDLNRTYLQPSPSGGVDTVTDANRIPDHTGNDWSTWDMVHVKLKIGTILLNDFDDPTLPSPNHPHVNAALNHVFGNFSWVFAPRLGNIGLSALEPFETIIDYTHQRLILIRLDSAGRRLAQVPAYTPKSSVTLLDMSHEGWYGTQQPTWGIAVGLGNILDTLDAGKNTKKRLMDTGAFENHDDWVGYPFLKRFGVIGFNHRTHQIIFYR